MNHVIFFILAFMLGLLSGHAQNTIDIEMYNFDSDKGNVKVGLYDSAGGFLEKVFRGKESEIKERKATASFTDVPDGTYAISVFHDEDGNGKLNMFMGMIPSEDYGTSNNAPSNFGPPKWEDAKFTVKGGETVLQKISL